MSQKLDGIGFLKTCLFRLIDAALIASGADELRFPFMCQYKSIQDELDDSLPGAAIPRQELKPCSISFTRLPERVSRDATTLTEQLDRATKTVFLRSIILHSETKRISGRSLLYRRMFL
jgi:hypothetical protein